MLFLGKILKVRGNKGEVVLSSSDYGFQKGGTVLLKSKKYHKTLIVEYTKEIHKFTIIKFEGVNTINDALKLVGYSLEISNSNLNPENEQTFEKYEVMDMNGRIWGEVKGVKSFSHNQILEVGEGDAVIYVPFTEEIVKKIDTKNHKILIDPPAGLKKLNVK